ncbi:hypothetical protein GXW78_12275 [Roseomonas terrae]|jgi:hypothetical protein|uniref:Uncharacterized protein n=1 Tax=Neoroseomonas terrae TaxID=424799 RepID=A0ABS5EHE4_9PROT|nr:hypothetical protein [Neoroseomonas terrae]MBR0650443.1 hypothetical protein [Neoroseomonas terrae]
MSGGPEAGPRRPDLRAAMGVVAEEYFRFLQGGPEPGTGDDTKAFAAHHAACRAALAHLEHLLKLARAMGEPDSGVEEVTTFLIEARQALSAFEQEEDPHGEEEQS